MSKRVYTWHRFIICRHFTTVLLSATVRSENVSIIWRKEHVSQINKVQFWHNFLVLSVAGNSFFFIASSTSKTELFINILKLDFQLLFYKNTCFSGEYQDGEFGDFFLVGVFKVEALSQIVTWSEMIRGEITEVEKSSQ